jgi:RNA polymerase sigma-70 factor (ECF subfamily)
MIAAIASSTSCRIGDQGCNLWSPLPEYSLRRNKMTAAAPDTDYLLEQVASGDDAARARLLDRHRTKLRNLIALRLDPRLAARIDPSDVVQESLADADRRLPEFLDERPLPFYLWLRELTLQRLVDVHRLHIRTQKRSVRREEARVPHLSDASVRELADRLVDPRGGPRSRLERKQDIQRLHQALEELPERDREILVLRHLEQLSVKDIAALLGVTAGAVKVRHVRALQRLRRCLTTEGDRS